MKSFYINSTVLLFLITLFTGCVSTTQQVKIPTSHIVPPNKARIIIERKSMFPGSACSHEISDNNQYIGVLGNGGIMKWDRDLSNFKLTATESKGFCGDFFSNNYNLKGGETYTFKMNMMTLDKNIKLVSGQIRTPKEQETIVKIKTKQSQELEDEKHKQEVQKFVTMNDIKGLKEYTEQNPSAVNFIEEKTLRLALTGPKDMKVGDIRRLLKDGKGERIVVSLIKRVKSPYKEFSIDEIDTLIFMGLSDTIIATMIDVTTEITKDNSRRQEQQNLLIQQQQIIQNNNSNQQNTQNVQKDDSNLVMDKITEEVTKQGIKMLLDNLF